MSEEQNQPPIVFISYSHDSEEHKTWVRDLAASLRNIGIDVILDQWEIGPGDDVPKFMEQPVRRALRVIMVCTEQYVRKADDGQGGAGYETMVMTGELVRDIGTRKFIPIIRQAGEKPILPACVSNRFFVDFSNDKSFAGKLEDLAREIQGAPRFEKPPLGSNPFTGPIQTADTAADLQGEVPSEPHQIYELALSYANEGNFAKWQDLIHREKTKAANALLQWKNEKESQLPQLKNDLPAYFLPAVATHSGVFAAAFAAIDSTDERFHNQLSLLDWILNPKGWERSGPLILVTLPELTLFAYQSLLGALALNRQRPDLAYRLAVTPIAERYVGRETQPLFKHNLYTGWPYSLDHNCALARIFLQMVAKEWQWLWKLFGGEDEVMAAIVGYYLFLNTVDFVSAVKAMKGTQTELRKLGTPIFLYQGEYVGTRAQSLFFGISDYIGEMIAENGISDASLPELWNLWVKNCAAWVGAVYQDNRLLIFTGIPHRELPTMLLRGPTNRLIE